jgi:alpha-L-fucosidase 2
MAAVLSASEVIFETRRNLEYSQSNGASLLMDASVPMAKNATVPAVIIVHGGGWVRGDRRIDVEPLFEPLTRAGFAWFSISYRLATNVTQFGLGVEDVESAVRFVRSHAGEFHVDGQALALIGESAGGQLASIAALQLPPSETVKAVVGLYPPTDLVALLRNSNYVPAQIRASVENSPWSSFILAGLNHLSPIENVRPDMPPFLLIHGTADSLVPFEQSTAMCKRMREAGASCEIYPVAGAGHGIRWWSQSRSAGYQQKMVDWLRLKLGVPEKLGS